MGRAPLGGPAGVDSHHREAAVGGHLHQPVAELPGGDAGDRAAEALAAPPATKRLPAGVPHIREPEVFDADGAAAPLAGEIQQRADRRA